MDRKRRGLHQLFSDDPDAADWRVFGRRTDPVTRRGFLRGLGRMSALLGANIVFAELMPAGLIPAALAQSEQPFAFPGKHPGLLVLNDRPVNAETPPHLLDDPVTPADRLFVRNNGVPPPEPDPAKWSLVVDGAAAKMSRTFTIESLKRDFEPVSLQLVLECSGNGRHEFFPPASGNQWTTGAVGCPRWDGVRLRDVLAAVGWRDDAVYVAYHGADRHLSGNPATEPISRGVPIAKALEPDSMIAWGMNGGPLPVLNGQPLRLVFGGWPGSTSGKWLERIQVRDRIHDGPKMGGKSYRVPCEPVAPGTDVPDEQMCIIESMPVKSLITRPKTGMVHPRSEPLEVGGHAWSGEGTINRVELSIDYGQHWRPAEVAPPANRHAWQHWRAELAFPRNGYYEVWARATDAAGRSQPMVVPGWNPKGYLNNACHRIAIRAV